jgi:hypothetical protein
MNRMFYLLLVSMLFVSFVADAGLIRGAGIGHDSSSEAQNFYRIADQYTDALGVRTNFISTDSETLVSGKIPLFAVPSDCYIDISFSPPNFVNDPCYYQFYQNEMLQFEGYMAMFFENSSLVDLVWTITGAGYSQSFSGSYINRMASLETAMPLLAAGEYQLGLMVTFYAGAGYKFYTDPSVHSDNLNCGELNPGDQNSVSCSYGWIGADTLSFSSRMEKIVILAGDKPVDIPAPASVLLLLLGGGLLCGRLWKQ